MYWFYPYDISTDYENKAPGEGPFYTNYLKDTQEYANVGLEYVDWNETRYTKLAEHKADLISLFDNQFAFREIGAETETRFQSMLQIRFNQIADKYNHAYKVTEENDVDQLGTGYSYDELRKRNIESQGTANGNETRDSKYKDTPQSYTSTINNPTNQNIDARQNSSTATTKEAQTDEVHQNKVQHDKEMILELNDLIDKYKQLDVDFVNEFETCFMMILQ